MMMPWCAPARWLSCTDMRKLIAGLILAVLGIVGLPTVSGAMTFHHSINPAVNCSVTVHSPAYWDGVGTRERDKTCWVLSYNAGGATVTWHIVEASYTNGLRRVVGNRHDGTNWVYAAMPGVWLQDAVGTELIGRGSGGSQPATLEFCVSSSNAESQWGYGITWDVPRRTLGYYGPGDPTWGTNGYVDGVSMWGNPGAGGTTSDIRFTKRVQAGWLYTGNYDMGDVIGSGYHPRNGELISWKSDTSCDYYVQQGDHYLGDALKLW